MTIGNYGFIVKLQFRVRGEEMVYRVRRIKLDNIAEICWRAKRCETYLTMQDLHIGGIYQLHGGKLYVVESKEG